MKVPAFLGESRAMSPLRQGVILTAILVLGCRGPRPADGRHDTHQPKPKEVAAQLGAAQPVSAQPAPNHPACLAVSPGKPVGKLAEDGLDEVSGVVASRVQPDLLWVHNDSGDGPRVYALEPSGRLRMEVVLRGADAVDFEDIAIGPGPREGKSYLYVGDIGDNFARRDQVQIYWFEEPNLQGLTGSELTVSVHRLDVAYEGGARDAEALMVDPRSGDLFIVSKGQLFSRDAPVALYRVPKLDLQKSEVMAKPVLKLPLGPVTAADVMPDGSGVAIRNYGQLRYWPRAPDQSLIEALRGEPCAWPLADRGRQGEAFGFRADGRAYFTIAEGAEQPLYVYEIEP